MLSLFFIKTVMTLQLLSLIGGSVKQQIQRKNACLKSKRFTVSDLVKQKLFFYFTGNIVQ
jgi:hypothetical protein